jgi:hypothetical protein
VRTVRGVCGIRPRIATIAIVLSLGGCTRTHEQQTEPNTYPIRLTFPAWIDQEEKERKLHAAAATKCSKYSLADFSSRPFGGANQVNQISATVSCPAFVSPQGLVNADQSTAASAPATIRSSGSQIRLVREGGTFKVPVIVNARRMLVSPPTWC